MVILNQSKIGIIFLSIVLINITPACAFNIHEMDGDINTINKWKNGSGWYKFWHFTSFCKAGYDLVSKSDEMKNEASKLKDSAEAKSKSDKNHIAFEKQKELDSQVETYLNKKSAGEVNSPPETAFNDANEMKVAVHPEKMNISIETKVNDPKENDIVQIIGKVEGNDYAKYAYHYWRFESIENNAGEKQVKLYDGKKEVTLPYDKFKERFTGIIFEVTLIQSNPINIINQTNSTSLVNETNQTTITLNNQTTENPITSIGADSINKIIQKIYGVKIGQINSFISNEDEYIGYYDDIYLAGCILAIIALALGIIAGVCWILSIPTWGISAYWAAVFTTAAAVIGTAGGVCMLVGWKYGDNHKKTKDKLNGIKTDLENREIHIDL